VWPGLEAERLLQPRLIPVGSPQLLAGGPPVRQPSDCLLYPLLHDAIGMDWRLWLQGLGADHRDRRIARGIRFSDSTLLTRAAVAGQGLALLRDTYVADDVAAGRLKVAFDAPWPADFAYYVVTRPGASISQEQIASFKTWLMQEAASGA
jgi:LysR family glycine cleavage system transcriptional activator